MPLKLRRAADQFPDVGWPPDDGHLVVTRGDKVIGTLRRMDGGPQAGNWSWSITALYVPPGVMTIHGAADTRDEARAAFGKTLRAWLDHVGADDLTDDVLDRHGFGSGCGASPSKR